jgi:hypothetical protein
MAPMPMVDDPGNPDHRETDEGFDDGNGIHRADREPAAVSSEAL